VGEREDTEGVKVYEAYEVKQKREKLLCLLLRRKKIIYIYMFMKSLLGNFLKNGPLFTTNDSMMDADGWHHQVCAPRVLLGRGTGANLACRRDWLVLARQLLKCQYPSIFTL